MKKLIVMLLALTVMLSAAIVDQSRAQKVAENYYQNYAPQHAKGSAIKEVLTKEYLGEPAWYAFNFDYGHVIVSADDGINPIMGYSFDVGSYIKSDLENMNNPFNARFHEYAKGIVEEARGKGIIDSRAKKNWKDIESKIFPSKRKSAVGPLMDTSWGQTSPWNDNCPAGTPVGCVALAMHQIMRFHGGPATGASSNSYTDSWGSVTGEHSVDFSAQTYDWSLMQGLHADDYVGLPTESAEIAKLAYSLGVAVEMDYESGGSGIPHGQSTRVEYALETYFSFDPSATTSGLFNPTEDSERAMIMAEIDADRPIYWTGVSPSGGHAFVLDGYQTLNNEYHFNWGWGAGGTWTTLNTMNYSISNQYVTGLFLNEDLALMPAPSNLAGSVIDDDIVLTWDATIVDPMGTLVDYEIYRDHVFIGTTGDTTTTYTDENMPEGTYRYTVRAVYTGPDGHSPESAIFTIYIADNPTYKCPTAMTAESHYMNRQKIDLSWAKPFCGDITYSEDFESAVAIANPVGWTQRKTYDRPPTSWFEHGEGPNISHVTVSYSAAPFVVHTGDIGTYLGWITPGYVYLINDTVYDLTNITLSFWVSIGDHSKFDVILYSGDFTEADPSGNIIYVYSYDSEVDGDNYYDYVVNVDLSSYAGTTDYRIGFVNGLDNGNNLCFDDIVLGQDDYPDPTDQPTHYEIYVNDVLETTVPITGLTETYEDNDYFVDGWNKYYVRALFPGGNSSIVSAPSSAWIDANPKPYFLTGAMSADDVDLNWFAPYGSPPIWNGNPAISGSPDGIWDYIESFGDPSIPAYETHKNRTLFLAEDVGYFYPAKVDSISAAFGADPNMPWLSDQFLFTVYTSAEDGSDSLLWGPSECLTAVDGYYTTKGFPTLTMNQGWYVEVDPADDYHGTPSVFYSHATKANLRSMAYLYREGITDGWHQVGSGPGEGFELWVFSYITSALPPAVTKESGWSSSYEKMDLSFDGEITTNKKFPNFKTDLTFKKESQPITKGKGLTNYRIFRNDVEIGTSTTTTFTDLDPIAGDNYYEVTAVYTDPVGESDSTNVFLINPTGKQAQIELSTDLLTAYSPVGTTVVNSSFNLINDGTDRLDYNGIIRYDDPIDPITSVILSNDFESGLGTGWVTSGVYPFVVTPGLTGNCAKAAADSTAYIGVLTSPEFDGSFAYKLTLTFDHDAQRGTAHDWFDIDYYDGADWINIFHGLNQYYWGSLSIELPLNAKQLRFTTNIGVWSGYGQWLIDNVVVTAYEHPPVATWFSFGGSSTVNGAVTTVENTEAVNVEYDPTGLDAGVYNAVVTIYSNDPYEPVVILPVEFTVSDGIILPATPANITTSISADNLVIDWDVSANATGYDVYSSDDPYGTFTFAGSVGTNQYTVAADQAKLFYYITATNATKTATKTTKVVKTVKSVK